MGVLSELPWDHLRWAYRSFRKLFFTKERSDRPVFMVDASVTEIEAELGRHSFSPNWEFSYNYRGEDLNLARVVSWKSPEHPGIKWWQTHVRGFAPEGDGPVELQAHWEPEPTEHDTDHLEGTGFSAEKGKEILGEYLDQTDLEVVSDPR